MSTATGDHNYIKVNTKYFAIPVATGGGSLAVHNLDQPGRLPAQPAVLDGHRGPVLDFDFNPSHEQLIATGGDDCTVKVWGIPEEGLTETISEPLVDMAEHQRKVVVIRFHPTAEHVLASGSADHTVKIWDVQNGESKVDIPHDELLQDVVWNYDGSMLASSSKDKLMRIIDPRTGEVTASVEAHNGTKTSKLTYLGEHGTLCSVGFTRQSKRQFKIWDPRNITTPLHTMDIDQAAGVIMPFFDEGSNMLYLGGKGDGNIRYYEIVNDEPWAFSIETYRAASPCRGLAIMPKRGVNTEKVELARLYKLTSNTVEPLSFICPRKSELFQEDLYPDCFAGKPSMSADEFFAGKNKNPILMSMDPAKRTDIDKSNMASISHQLNKQKSAKQLQDEIDHLQAYVDKLTSALESAGVSVPEP